MTQGNIGGSLGSLTNLSGSGGVLIDVLSQDSKHSSNGGGQNFASTVITEVRVEDTHVELEVSDQTDPQPPRDEKGASSPSSSCPASLTPS